MKQKLLIFSLFYFLSFFTRASCQEVSIIEAQKIKLAAAQDSIQQLKQTLATLQANKQSKLQTSELPTMLLIGCVVVILGSGVYLLFKYTQLMAHNQKLELKHQQRLMQFSEVDKQKQLLANLQETQEDLMRGVAHDLKAPLNRVDGLVNVILLQDENLTQEQKKYLGLIQRVATEARTMIQNWLDVKSIEDQSMQIRLTPVPLQNLIQDLLTSYQDTSSKKKIAIKADLDIKSEYLLTDHNMLNRILDNLLSNAIKFSPFNEEVVFSVKEKDHEIIFAIEDHGVGISDKDKGKLFQKFQKLSARPTAGETSTGLGLSIVKTLVTQLKGKIEVESIVGEGSTFKVCLPKLNPNEELEASQVFTDNC